MKNILYALALLAFLTITAPLSAQSREDTLVYIAPVSAARPDHAIFFRDHFEMEIIGANYTLTDSIRQADYVINLEVRPNVIYYDDGTEDVPPPWEPQFVVFLGLVDNETDIEVVSLSFPFTEIEDIYEMSLTLVYSAMANVPITKLGEVYDESDRWRNKWLYIRASFDYPVITIHGLRQEGLILGGAIYNPQHPATRYQMLDHKILPVPGATLGLELQYLYWMSAELNVLLRFGDPLSNTFIPGIGVQLKFPVKPARHFMLEPYLMGATEMNTADHYSSFPRFSVGGGFQFGVKGGESGAFFIDINFLYSLGNLVTFNNNPEFTMPHEIHWLRYVIGVGIGYKIGFVDRPQRGGVTAP